MAPKSAARDGHADAACTTRAPATYNPAAMGNLRDALNKAKVLSDKDAKRLAHEERLQRKEVGRQGLEEQQQQRQQELARLREEERERTRQATEQQERERKAAAERAACEEILKRETFRSRGAGSRWHFQLADGHLPFLEVNEADRRQLQAGMLSVVRIGPHGTHVYGLLATPLAKRIAEQMPERVVAAPRGVVRERG